MIAVNTPTFDRQLKRLAKRHRSILADVVAKVGELLEDPYTGNALIAENCYKVRMAITSKGKGKSGGSRIITCVKIEQDTLYLLTIYDKSEREDLEDGELKELLKQIEN